MRILRSNMWGVLSLLLALGVAPALAQERIKVHVIAPEPAAEGFVDDTLKGQQDSFADLTERLQKTKSFEVVSDAGIADVTIEIRGRGWKETGETRTETTIASVFGVPNISSRTSADTTKEATVVLKAGTYEKEFSARRDQMFGAWKAIAGRLAGDIDKWVKENRATLLARREKK